MVAKLASRGAGKWQESGGEKSKFGLTAGEIVQVTERLREVGMLRSELEYASVPSPNDIEKFVDESRTAAIRAGDEVNRAFFRQHGTIVWSH